MDEEINLCDTCIWSFANCCADNFKFGNGKGNDNVVECDEYEEEQG